MSAGDGTLPRGASALLVAAGGTLGVGLRALLGSLAPVAPGSWPWTTWTINVTGSFVLGLLLTVLQRGPDEGRRRAVRLTAGTGVLGGFTTYSTFALEVEQLLTSGHAATGTAYALVSVVVGLAAAALGVAVAGRVPARRGGAP